MDIKDLAAPIQSPADESADHLILVFACSRRTALSLQKHGLIPLSVGTLTAVQAVQQVSAAWPERDFLVAGLPEAPRAFRPRGVPPSS